jgi:hypothetical protein
MRFDCDDTRISAVLAGQDRNVVYYGHRPQDSLEMHEKFARKQGYSFKFPPKSMYLLLDITRKCLAPKYHLRNLSLEGRRRDRRG